MADPVEQEVTDPEKNFEKIEIASREAELKTREKEKAYEQKIEAEMANGVSRGKAAQKVASDSLTELYQKMMSMYANDREYEKIAASGAAEDEYNGVIAKAFEQLFGQNGALKLLENHINAHTEDYHLMESNKYNDGKNLRNALRGLSAAAKTLEGSLLFKESDNDKKTRQLLGDIYDLQTSIERDAYGNLYVPHDDVKYDERGKKIHRVVQKRDANNKWIQPEIAEKKRYGLSNANAFVKLNNFPLFDHAPNESDVAQGGLGNCYMMASLASTAASAPEIIKDHMKYNPADNTVTVLFYNDSQEPVYVTVDCSVPLVTGTTADGTEVQDKIFSRRAYWAQIYEKAYAVSGLATGDLSAAEKGKHNPKYEDISNGQEKNFMSQLFGYKTHDIYAQIRADDNLNRDFYDIMERPFTNLTLGSGDQPYTPDETQMYLQIHRAIHAGHAVTSAINRDKKHTGAGLVSGHAYSLLRVENDQASGKLYVVIRNPHAHGAREYDANGNAIASQSKDLDGISRIELRDYLKTFSSYTEARHDTSRLEQLKNAEYRDTKLKYGKAVSLIHKALEENDNGFLRMFGQNSDQFNKFRVSALQAYKQFNAGTFNVAAMKDAVRNMVQAAKDYKAYRDNNPDEEYDNTATRSENRYNLATFTEFLGEAFDRMEAPDSKVCREVDPVELVKIMKAQNAQPATAAATAAKERIGELEQKAMAPGL